MASKILVVDDEPGIVEMIKKFLSREGFLVKEAYDGPTALDIVQKENPDLIILDIMLPGLDGLEVLKRLRAKSDVPVIMLTARSEEVDKLLGLGLGADDYVTKPFSLRELTFRIRAILRRWQKGGGEKVIRVGDLVIDAEKMEVTVGGKKVDLTRAEFQLLYTLLSRPGKVFTREELLNAAFGEAYEGYERTIDTHIWNLRRKIEANPQDPRYILTVYGVGYKGGVQKG
ncbi:MAG: response regulator transcription factor [Candidatus Fermentithermobacillus carboniphilus]|uniref:Response regulator transcription factor n=1 Tax=Candidatus Fermentithermobacillus carboniphilus TaxID=3085328 RepID=A0AAT9LBG1_9FIRM|nr:MAG: response regulator transcription factor [Candidatus Fermentithermobacillus carboniphilus]